MKIDTTNLHRCVAALEAMFDNICQLNESDRTIYEKYRAACIKEFELVLEHSGILMRKLVALYLSSNQQADAMSFKDVFRQAALRNITSANTTERWLKYQDLRNDSAHEYGEKFA